MNTIQTNYQALVTEENEVPHESVIFHAASEGGKLHWNHIGDLDTFFRRVYKFHQKGGYICILLERFLYLIFTVAIYTGLVYIMHCIEFNFDEPSSPLYNKTDIHIQDLFLPLSESVKDFGFWTWSIVFVGIVNIMYKCYDMWHTAFSYYDTKQFVSSALKVDKDEIKNITWHEMQCRLREVQHEQQMCVHKSDLTELDISHRLLRHNNYMVAMVNKNILPLKHNMKFLGEWAYLSSGLQYNIQLLLFGSSLSSPFDETGKLKEEYKMFSKRNEAAVKLRKYILYLGIINALLSPFIFLYQCLFFFVTYAGIVRHSPSFLSTRTWSLYSRLYLRHFNELDHELHTRLCRAYKPSKEYMKSFSSPIGVIVFKFLAQIFGCTAAFFFIWGLVKEKLLMVNHVIIIIFVCTVLFVAFWSCVPHENAIYFPHLLMQRIIADVHYVPDHFRQKAHTTAVRDEFSQLFQYKFVTLLEDLISPWVTPYILIFHLRPRALDLVDFFRNFTVDVAGVGDVCSFSLMDVSKHGNHHWLSEAHTKADQHRQAEDGKTELSLVHFTLMNPHWQPPPASNMFIHDLRERVNNARDGPAIRMDDPYYASINSLSSMDPKYASLVNSIHYPSQPAADGSHIFSLPTAQPERYVGVHSSMFRAEGPPYLTQAGLLTSMHGDLGAPASLHSNLNPMEVRAAEMSFSALYMHGAHQRFVESSRSEGIHHRQHSQESENNGDEESPLLEVRTLEHNYVQ